MGIDACMFVRHKGVALSEDEIRSLSGDLVAALGTNRLWVMRPADSPHCPEGRHALEAIEVYHQDGSTLTPEPGEQFIEVHLWGRFYGPGYERGDWPNYDAICQWFKARMPNAAVWYGGDSSGVSAVEMTDDFREAMWTHFAMVGHDPYMAVFSSKTTTRVCAFCRRMMHQYGTGPNYQAWKCDGCGLDEVTKDGGTTWAPREKGARP